MKYRSKRLLNLPLTALSVLFASVILFGGTASAQPLPLSEAEKIIQQQSQEVEQKATFLLNTSQEIQTLEQKKLSLLTQLEQETKAIEELRQKVEQKRIAAEKERKRVEELKKMFVQVRTYAPNSSGNLYAPGNCTWYAKSMRPDLPNNLGNANTWYARAAAQGWNVGSTPKKGAVATTTAGGLGHVAYVIGVSLDGQQVTIREMNYRGLYSMNTRTVHYTEFKYIYELN